MLLKMAAQWPLCLLLLCLLTNMLMAVKIGVSKVSTTTTTMAPNITHITTIEPEVSTTDATTEELTTTSTSTSTTTTTAKTTTVQSILVFPEFPPRKTKTSIRTTTQKPTTTSTTATTTTTTTTVKPPDEWVNSIKQTILLNNGNYYCPCDFLKDACDINCCCDRDCSWEALQVFSCHMEHPYVGLDQRFYDFQYQHGLPSCKINDGWLCVFRTNIAAGERTKVISSNLDTTYFSKWPDQLLNAAEEDADSSFDFYKYGEPLKLFNMETFELQTFDLPYSYKPPHCQLEEPVRHLKSQRSSCLVRNVEELQETNKKMLQLVTTTKLLVKPKIQMNELESLDVNLLDIQMQRCELREEREACFKMPVENVTMEFERENYCITGIKIKLLHNYTHIIAAVIELREQLLKHIDEEALWQTFDVQFILKNHTEITKEPEIDLFKLELDEKAISGALGYLPGAPIIMAKFIAYNESQEITTHNRVLNYFHENASILRKTHSLPLFTRRHELCHQNGNPTSLISYGISTLIQCKVRLDNETLATSGHTAELNFTAICLRLQQLAEHQLYGDEMHLEQLPELFISQLGKPQNSSDKWTLLHIRNYEYTPITAQYNEQTQSFTCHNVVLSAAYEFFIGTFTEQGVPGQAVVQQAVLVVGPRHDLEFSLHELLEVPLTVSVMFYDYTTWGVGSSGSTMFPNISTILYVCLSLVLKLVSN